MWAGTFFLRSLAFSMSIYRNFQSNRAKWWRLKLWTEKFIQYPNHIYFTFQVPILDIWGQILWFSYSFWQLLGVGGPEKRTRNVQISRTRKVKETKKTNISRHRGRYIRIHLSCLGCSHHQPCTARFFHSAVMLQGTKNDFSSQKE